MRALYQDRARGGLWLPCKLLDDAFDKQQNADEDIPTYAIKYEGEIFGVFSEEVIGVFSKELKLINKTHN